MTLEKQSFCKVNLLLNILGRRPDGFHELETVMHPVNLSDTLTFSRITRGIELSCSEPALLVDSTNLVHRAAAAFFQKARISDGVAIRLNKKIPMAAGLGGGSANAATTLLTLNELFDQPLNSKELQSIAAQLGSDVPFFLQSKPAVATGRGEKIQPLDFFPALRGTAFILMRPGFGISTAWAYQQLGRFPEALKGKAGRAEKLIRALQTSELSIAARDFYNSLEGAAFYKFPLLRIIQDFFQENGVLATLMSGSGSTTFAIARDSAAAHQIEGKLREHFGEVWTAVAAL